MVAFIAGNAVLGQRYGLGTIAEVACKLDCRTEADLSFPIRTGRPHHRRQNVKVDKVIVNEEWHRKTQLRAKRLRRSQNH
jgi:hypothetical protein